MSGRAISRRSAIVTTLGFVLAPAAADAQDSAANFPNHPIRVIVSFPAGGGVDTFTRIVTDRMRGELGQPPDGWPQAILSKVLKGAKPIEGRPGALLPETDLTAARNEAECAIGRTISDSELASFLMYPRVFTDYALTEHKYGPVSLLSTQVFFYGMRPQDEVAIEIERGKALVIQLQAVSEVDEDGQVKVFFELNGQPRMIRVPDRAVAPRVAPRRQADEGDFNHVAAPMPGIVTTVLVAPGQGVHRGEVLVVHDPVLTRLSGVDVHVRGNRPGKFFGEVARILYDHIEDRVGEPVAGMTREELRGYLAAKGFPAELVESLTRELENCDFARFASSASGPGEMRAALRRVRALLGAVERVKLKEREAAPALKPKEATA